MSSIIILPRSSSTTLTQVASGGAAQAILPGTFLTVMMTSIDSDVGSNWDSAANHYIVPSAGLYQITATLRAADNQPAGRQFGVGLHSANVDGNWFLWHAIQTTLNIERRTTYPYIRTDFFNAGERLRLFTYSDQGFTVDSAVLNIFRVT